MKQDEFTLALNALLPGCDPEAASKWAEFAIECVEQEQFAHFIPMEHDTAIEKWMDTTFAGLCAVKHEYGPEIATKVADLACQRCALYPGQKRHWQHRSQRSGQQFERQCWWRQ